MRLMCSRTVCTRHTKLCSVCCAPPHSRQVGDNRVNYTQNGDCKLQHLSCFWVCLAPPSVLCQSCDCHGPLDPLRTLSRCGAAARQEGVGLHGAGQGRAGHTREDVHVPCHLATLTPIQPQHSYAFRQLPTRNALFLPKRQRISPMRGWSE